MLGKWKQTALYAPGNDTNLLSECERESNTIFNFRSAGKCAVASPANCVPHRVSSYALSADGQIFAFEGIFYYVYKLNATEFEFSLEPEGAGYRQVWVRTN